GTGTPGGNRPEPRTAAEGRTWKNLGRGEPMITRRECILAVPAVAAILHARVAPAAESNSFSEAERLLFTQDHFKSLKEATHIEYEYRVRGSLDDEFVDKVKLAVSKKKPSGKHDVQVDF